MESRAPHKESTNAKRMVMHNQQASFKMDVKNQQVPISVVAKKRKMESKMSKDGQKLIRDLQNVKVSVNKSSMIPLVSKDQSPMTSMMPAEDVSCRYKDVRIWHNNSPIPAKEILNGTVDSMYIGKNAVTFTRIHDYYNGPGRKNIHIHAHTVNAPPRFRKEETVSRGKSREKSPDKSKRFSASENVSSEFSSSSSSLSSGNQRSRDLRANLLRDRRSPSSTRTDWRDRLAEKLSVDNHYYESTMGSDTMGEFNKEALIERIKTENLGKSHGLDSFSIATHKTTGKAATVKPARRRPRELDPQISKEAAKGRGISLGGVSGLGLSETSDVSSHKRYSAAEGTPPGERTPSGSGSDMADQKPQPEVSTFKKEPAHERLSGSSKISLRSRESAATEQVTLVQRMRLEGYSTKSDANTSSGGDSIPSRDHRSAFQKAKAVGPFQKVEVVFPPEVGIPSMGGIIPGRKSAASTGIVGGTPGGVTVELTADGQTRNPSADAQRTASNLIAKESCKNSLLSTVGLDLGAELVIGHALSMGMQLPAAAGSGLPQPVRSHSTGMDRGTEVSTPFVGEEVTPVSEIAPAMGITGGKQACTLSVGGISSETRFSVSGDYPYVFSGDQNSKSTDAHPLIRPTIDADPSVSSAASAIDGRRPFLRSVLPIQLEGQPPLPIQLGGIPPSGQQYQIPTDDQQLTNVSIDKTSMSDITKGLFGFSDTKRVGGLPSMIGISEKSALGHMSGTIGSKETGPTIGKTELEELVDYAETEIGASPIIKEGPLKEGQSEQAPFRKGLLREGFLKERSSFKEAPNGISFSGIPTIGSVIPVSGIGELVQVSIRGPAQSVDGIDLEFSPFVEPSDVTSAVTGVIGHPSLATEVRGATGSVDGVTGDSIVVPEVTRGVVDGPINGVAGSVALALPQGGDSFTKVRGKCDPVTAQADPVIAEADPITAEVDSFTAEVDPVTVEVDSFTAETDPATAEADSFTAEADPVTAEADSFTAEVDTVTAEADTVTAEADTVTSPGAPVSVTAQVDPVTARVGPVTVQADSVTAQVDPVASPGVPASVKGDPVTAQADAVTARADPVTVQAEFESSSTGRGHIYDPATIRKGLPCVSSLLETSHSVGQDVIASAGIPFTGEPVRKGAIPVAMDTAKGDVPVKDTGRRDIPTVDTGKGVIAVAIDTAKGVIPVAMDTAKGPIPVAIDTAKGAIPVAMDTAKGDVPVKHTWTGDVPFMDTGKRVTSVAMDTAKGAIPFAMDTAKGDVPVKDTREGVIPVAMDTAKGAIPVAMDTAKGDVPAMDTGNGIIPVAMDTAKEALPVAMDTAKRDVSVKDTGKGNDFVMDTGKGFIPVAMDAAKGAIPVAMATAKEDVPVKNTGKGDVPVMDAGKGVIPIAMDTAKGAIPVAMATAKGDVPVKDTGKGGMPVMGESSCKPENSSYAMGAPADIPCNRASVRAYPSTEAYGSKPGVAEDNVIVSIGSIKEDDDMKSQSFFPTGRFRGGTVSLMAPRVESQGKAIRPTDHRATDDKAMDVKSTDPGDDKPTDHKSRDDKSTDVPQEKADNMKIEVRVEPTIQSQGNSENLSGQVLSQEGTDLSKTYRTDFENSLGATAVLVGTSGSGSSEIGENGKGTGLSRQEGTHLSGAGEKNLSKIGVGEKDSTSSVAAGEGGVPSVPEGKSTVVVEGESTTSVVSPGKGEAASQDEKGVAFLGASVPAVEKGGSSTPEKGSTERDDVPREWIKIWVSSKGKPEQGSAGQWKWCSPNHKIVEDESLLPTPVKAGEQTSNSFETPDGSSKGKGTPAGKGTPGKGTPAGKGSPAVAATPAGKGEESPDSVATPAGMESPASAGTPAGKGKAGPPGKGAPPATPGGKGVPGAPKGGGKKGEKKGGKKTIKGNQTAMTALVKNPNIPLVDKREHWAVDRYGNAWEYNQPRIDPIAGQMTQIHAPVKHSKREELQGSIWDHERGVGAMDTREVQVPFAQSIFRTQTETPHQKEERLAKEEAAKAKGKGSKGKEKGLSGAWTSKAGKGFAPTAKALAAGRDQLKARCEDAIEDLKQARLSKRARKAEKIARQKRSKTRQHLPNRTTLEFHIENYAAICRDEEIVQKLRAQSKKDALNYESRMNELAEHGHMIAKEGGSIGFRTIEIEISSAGPNRPGASKVVRHFKAYAVVGSLISGTVGNNVSLVAQKLGAVEDLRGSFALMKPLSQDSLERIHFMLHPDPSTTLEKDLMLTNYKIKMAEREETMLTRKKKSFTMLATWYVQKLIFDAENNLAFYPEDVEKEFSSDVFLKTMNRYPRHMVLPEKEIDLIKQRKAIILRRQQEAEKAKKWDNGYEDEDGNWIADGVKWFQTKDGEWVEMGDSDSDIDSLESSDMDSLSDAHKSDSEGSPKSENSPSTEALKNREYKEHREHTFQESRHSKAEIMLLDLVRPPLVLESKTKSLEKKPILLTPPMKAYMEELSDSLSDPDSHHCVMDFRFEFNDQIQLNKAEKMLQALLSIPDIERKLKIFQDQLLFEEKLAILTDHIADMHEACGFIRESDALKKSFAVILTFANALHAGTPNERADGFGLEMLSKLSSTKAKHIDAVLKDPSLLPQLTEMHKAVQREDRRELRRNFRTNVLKDAGIDVDILTSDFRSTIEIPEEITEADEKEAYMKARTNAFIKEKYKEVVNEKQREELEMITDELTERHLKELELFDDQAEEVVTDEPIAEPKETMSEGKRRLSETLSSRLSETLSSRLEGLSREEVDNLLASQSRKLATQSRMSGARDFDEMSIRSTMSTHILGKKNFYIPQRTKSLYESSPLCKKGISLGDSEMNKHSHLQDLQQGAGLQEEDFQSSEIVMSGLNQISCGPPESSEDEEDETALFKVEEALISPAGEGSPLGEGSPFEACSPRDYTPNDDRSPDRIPEICSPTSEKENSPDLVLTEESPSMKGSSKDSKVSRQSKESIESKESNSDDLNISSPPTSPVLGAKKGSKLSTKAVLSGLLCETIVEEDSERDSDRQAEKESDRGVFGPMTKADSLIQEKVDAVIKSMELTPRESLAVKEKSPKSAEEESKNAKEEFKNAKEESKNAKEESKSAKEESRNAKEESKSAKEKTLDSVPQWWQQMVAHGKPTPQTKSPQSSPQSSLQENDLPRSLSHDSVTHTGSRSSSKKKAPLDIEELSDSEEEKPKSKKPVDAKLNSRLSVNRDRTLRLQQREARVKNKRATLAFEKEESYSVDFMKDLPGREDKRGLPVNQQQNATSESSTVLVGKLKEISEVVAAAHNKNLLPKESEKDEAAEGSLPGRRKSSTMSTQMKASPKPPISKSSLNFKPKPKQISLGNLVTATDFCVLQIGFSLLGAFFSGEVSFWQRCKNLVATDKATVEATMLFAKNLVNKNIEGVEKRLQQQRTTAKHNPKMEVDKGLEKALENLKVQLKRLDDMARQLQKSEDDYRQILVYLREQPDMRWEVAFGHFAKFLKDIDISIRVFNGATGLSKGDDKS